MSGMAKLAAKLGHLGLYLLMFALPISGWVLSSAAGRAVSMFELFDLPDLVSPDKDFAHNVKEFHEMFADGLMVLLAVHIIAALVHQFYYKDGVLRQMLPNCKSRKVGN
jgi:cytochrome b561